MNFLDLKKEYTNTELFNNYIHKEFTQKTSEIDWLFNHRLNVESNNLGFGDRAFHYMWFVILSYFKENQSNSKINALEIGVYKGQVISLWSLISKKIELQININAISPFKGNPQSKNRFIHKVKMLLSKKFRDMHSSANFYEEEDYLRLIEKHFKTHGLNLEEINKYIGFSTEPDIISKVNNLKFDIYRRRPHI